MKPIATNRHVDRAELEAFVAPRHRGVLLTARADGRPQSSLVTFGLSDGELLVSSYPSGPRSTTWCATPTCRWS